MAIVYRVEHKTKGIGPYTAAHRFRSNRVRERLQNVRQELLKSHAYSSSHPDIFNDDLKDLDLGHYARQLYFCCFDSIDKLKSWFDGFIDLLHESKFICRAYEVDEKYVLRTRSGRQTAFKIEFAKRISTIPLDKLASMC